MTFIVILMALLIERFFDWSHLRKWYWFNAYEKQIQKYLPTKSAYVLLACLIMPLLITVLLMQYMFEGVLFGFVNLLFQLFILLYCLGPQNLWADSFACVNAIIHGDAPFAAEKLKTAFGITEVKDQQAVQKKLLGNIFIESNLRVFAVIFWYAVLGPVGAILYRAISRLSPDMGREETNVDLTRSAQTVEGVLDWIPVRIFTFLFALGGHFVHVLSQWRRYVLSGFSSNSKILIECGRAALGHDGDENIKGNDGAAERSAIHLLDRALIILLVIIAVGVVVI